MKALLSIILLSFSFLGQAQKREFPQNWEGNWKGKLNWFRTGNTEPQQVDMELRIHKSASGWSWHIIYGTEKEDSRPYILKPADSTGIHWVIDENNGIVLDQFWIADKFSGAFTVMNSTLMNSYQLLGDSLVVEFYSFGAKPLNTTGGGTAENPKVDSYRIGAYQKAVLYRRQ
ncbi:MAG TPA: hypothetical protein P5158_09575 [Chitinophagaceae bacterium]|nr:hypothetical protein [Chitinophagaceae bacterium]